MIYYPISVLMLAGHSRDTDNFDPPPTFRPFRRLLGDGSDFGVSLRVRRAAPLPTAWLRHSSSARSFVGGRLRLPGAGATNIFPRRWPVGLPAQGPSVRRSRRGKATVFGLLGWGDPERLRRLRSFDRDGKLPEHRGEARAPRSRHYAGRGPFISTPNKVLEVAKTIRPPRARGELENHEREPGVS